MSASHDAIRFVTSGHSPLAPSPVAATMNGSPGSGVVPAYGVNVFVFTGVVALPLLNVNVIEGRCVIRPSPITTSADSE